MGNFRERGEVGASLAVSIAGELVVDVWGGMAEPETGVRWTEDTISIVFSNTKAATALCLHLLVERGDVELDAPVSRYWPAFGRDDKRAITVRMLLDHTAGLPAFREPLRDGGVFDWDYMVERLEWEEPHWRPGTRGGYHGLTFGWLVGEVVRRVSGMSLGTFFRRSVADELGLDYWIGLPEAAEHRVAPIIRYRPDSVSASAYERALEDPGSIASLYFFNTGGWRPNAFNSRAGRAAEIPAANGITNARGLARFYAPLANAGRHANGRLLHPQTILALADVSAASHEDATLLVPMRFGAGFMRSMDNRARGMDSAIIGRHAFGHVGAGGSIGFADPELGMSFGYTMNRMGRGVLLNERGQSLVDTAYAIARAG